MKSINVLKKSKNNGMHYNYLPLEIDDNEVAGAVKNLYLNPKSVSKTHAIKTINNEQKRI